MTSEEIQAKDHDLLVKLNSKVDFIIETLKQIPQLEERVRTVEKTDEKREEQISTIKNEIEKLRNTNTTWSIINTIGIFIAGALGFK